MGKLGFVAYIITFVCAVISWVVLLAGNASLNSICPGDCRYTFGLPWWSIWFEFFILLASIPVGVLGMRSLKSGVLALLAANTALTMLLTDNSLQIKGLDSYYSQWEARCNALVAGFLLVSVFNVILILVLGLMDEEGAKAGLPQHQSAYSNSPPPHTIPTFPPRG